MFACLYSLSSPLQDLVKVAEDFTPRFEIVGSPVDVTPDGASRPAKPLVVLDLSGLSRLFGSARDIGEQLRRSLGGAPVRIAIAGSQTAAALLALERPGLTVVSRDEQPAAIAALPVRLLGELETRRTRDESARRPLQHAQRSRARHAPPGSPARVASSPFQSSSASLAPLASTVAAPEAPLVAQTPVVPSGAPFGARHVGEMEDVLPYFQSCLDRTSELASKPHANCGGGWMHPRDTHGAQLTKIARRDPARMAKVNAALKDVSARLDVLRRWGIHTLGALAALPPADVYERLGARGVAWQRLARGQDEGPLVPCVPEEPFEAALDLEWPIEGLEPLSFVLARLIEPLSERLECADRGAAILHAHLRLTTRDVHARTVQLPAPMRDARTLRALMLLDLESNPPPAGIDCVRVFIEPTPAKVLQWTLYDRAQPSPEQVSTLLARLIALMGEGHVGSPTLVNSWRPGAFALMAFAPEERKPVTSRPAAGTNRGASPGTALRRFRLPIPARVRMQDGRPVRVMVDRRGINGGVVLQSAGPWRTSGEWWQDADAWDRDEWDIVVAGGAAYRIFVERNVGQWFVEAVID